MEKDINELFYRKLESEKIKINWNENPIEMGLFLSFLTTETERSSEHLGSCNGWTKLTNDDINLIIKGGVVNGVEYLDSIQFGNNLSNPYNNFVNPFYLFEILKTEGKRFFIDYYKDDINKITSDKINKIQSLKNKLNNEKFEYNSIIEETNLLIELSK